MGEWTKVKAQDGNELAVYVARPAGEAVGVLVLVQEIFGVNRHIRNVCDGYAADGFVVFAPAIFDRFEKGVDLDYTPEGWKHAVELMGKLRPETTLMDVAATYELAQAEGKGIGVVGYCYGGLTAWLVAVRGEVYKMQPACCVGYYAGGIGKYAAEESACPVMLHFGAEDSHIGKDQIEAVRSAHPEVTIFEYAGAGHAFNREPDPSSYKPEAAKLARERTIEFLRVNIA